MALAALVSLAHWWLAQFLPDVRIGQGNTERMPQRIEVAYVRELAQSAPPAAAPVVVARRAPARPAAAAKKPAPAASAASAPEVPAEPAPDANATGDDERMARAEPTEPPLAPEPEPGPTAASAPDASASAVVAFEWPPSTRLSYRLSGNYRGEVSGGAQVEWARVGERYQVHLDVWVGAQAAPLVGRRMSSDGEITDQGLSPRRYDEETRALFRELRRRTIVFDGARVLLPNGKQLDALPGVQDAASQFVQLTWLFTTRPDLLKVGQRIEVPLALPTRVDHWAYDVVEAVRLDTPVGEVDTFHLRPQLARRGNRDLVADVWFAPTLQYLPVRLLIRQDEATYIDMMLDRLPLQADPVPGGASAPR
jgi:Protein of unknown function (DUF3108)